MHALLFLIFCFSSNAQKIGNVSMDLLKQTTHPIDSTAHAAYTNQSAKATYVISPSGSLSIQVEYYYQIKIYDDQGEKYADFSLPYYESKDDEKIINIKAYTTNLENGKAVKTQLNKKDIFKEETSEHWRAKKFAMPKVKAGSVVELKYTLVSPFIYAIPKWYFQHYIPTDFSEFILEIPAYFSLTPVPSGSVPLERKEDDTFRGSEQVRRYTLTAKGVKAIKEDKYVLNENDYRGGVKFELNSVTFPGRPIKNFSKSWDEIAENLSENEYDRELFRSFKEFKPLIEEAKALPEQERLALIYTYVQQNFAWNKGYRIQCRDGGLKKVVEEKAGSCVEINLLLVNLLKKAGLDVYPMVMKSRGKGLLNTYFPTLTELNYLAAYVKIGDETIVADATSKYVPLGQLPNRAVNINGVVVNDKKGEIVMFDNPNLYKVQTMYKVELDMENNSLKGDAQQRRSAYAATRYRLDKLVKEKDKTSDDEDENEEDDEDMDATDIKNTYKVIETKNFDDINKSITIKSEAEIVTATKIIADKIFIDATLDFGLEENYFTEEEREFPVFYNFRIDRKNIASIKIPEGYAIESTPEEVTVGLPEGKGSFTYEVKTQGDKLMIYHTLKINNDILLPSDYPSLKEFYNIMFRLTKEKIVLSKKG